MVYICHASRGECDLTDRCLIHEIKPEPGERVMHFVSEFKGEHCPHFLSVPKKREKE